MGMPEDWPRLTNAQQSALYHVGALLTEAKVAWALTGSASLAIRGLDVVPHDLDIQTDAAGAYIIQRLLAPYMVWPVRYRISSTIRSHFGRAVVAGVFVEIMGAIEKQRQDGTWTSPPDMAELVEWVDWAGRVWPVLPLAYEASAYRTLGRTETAERLEQWLTDHPGLKPED